MYVVYIWIDAFPIIQNIKKHLYIYFSAMTVLRGVMSVAGWRFDKGGKSGPVRKPLS